MLFRFAGSPTEVTVYLLCVATSLLCAWLLARAYLRSRARLLIWSSLCFALLALNNFVLAVDILLLPEVDLAFLRIVTALLVLMPQPDERRIWFYLLRIAAYLLIIVAIVRKNAEQAGDD